MTTIRRSETAIYQRLGQKGGVLLHVDTGAYHELNETGALIWDMLDTVKSTDELISALRSRFEGAPPELERDVIEFLEELRDREMIVMEPGSSS